MDQRRVLNQTFCMAELFAGANQYPAAGSIKKRQSTLISSRMRSGCVIASRTQRGRTLASVVTHCVGIFNHNELH